MMKKVLVGLISLAFVGTLFVELAPADAGFRIRRVFRRIIRRPNPAVARAAAARAAAARAAVARATAARAATVRAAAARAAAARAAASRAAAARAAAARAAAAAKPKVVVETQIVKQVETVVVDNLPKETVVLKSPDAEMKKEIKVDVKAALNKALSTAKSATKDKEWQAYFKSMLGK